MQKLRMTTTARGSEDGFHVKLFEAGIEAWIADSLACDFLRRGLAERVANPGSAPAMKLPRARERNVTFELPESSIVKRMKGERVWARY